MMHLYRHARAGGLVAVWCGADGITRSGALDPSEYALWRARPDRIGDVEVCPACKGAAIDARMAPDENSELMDLEDRLKALGATFSDRGWVERKP